MYEQWTPKKSSDRSRGTASFSRRSKGRFQQLLVSCCLFAFVFVGQGVFPHKFERTNALILEHFGGETDFAQAFQNLGTALAQEEFQLQDIESFCKEVFGSGQGIQEEAVMVLQPMVEYVPPLDYFSIDPVWHDAVEVFGVEKMEESITTEWNYVPEPLEEEETMEIGTVLQAYDSEDIPDNHSNDFLYLGERETISPVYSMVTSEYGMRIGPLTGVLAMHRGIDLVASTGTLIVSWSDGVVETVGETSEVGLYVRVNHGDEIRSFYAHCSEILVEEGQEVNMGEEIALAGESGKVTGAHLHFELSWNGMYLNPLHYIGYEGIF